MGRGFAFFGDRGLLAAHGIGHRLRLALGPDAVGLEFGVDLLGVARRCIGGRLLPFGVKPFGRVVASLRGKGGVHFPIVAADELADFFLAFHHHRQRGCLHPAHGGQEEAAIARVERRHGARAVDADQPVGLGAATRGVGQRQHLGIGAQGAKAVADGLRRHGLQPQAAHRLAQGLGATGVLLDQAKDQLALTPGIAGVDEFVHVLALGLFDDGIEPRLGFVHRLQVEVRRNHRQVGKTPFAALDVKFLWRLDFHQVADGTGDDVAVVLEMLVVLFEFARHGRERLDDVLRYGRLLGNY